ncbi:MAG: GntR family transcriptional regulator [Gammaproteobacteria bacterium]|nr:GntR family transcriptional regulator [Gammaproteobacteria bacterium]
MSENWDDKSPIYHQLKERVAKLIMDGSFAEGEAIPSVRQVSSEYKINHITVSKAYQELVDMGVLEMRRGRGMFVLTGAQTRLIVDARNEFENIELPEIVKRASQLGISSEELIQKIERFVDGS